MTLTRPRFLFDLQELPFYTPEKYGAEGGTTDDTVALQAAINAAIADDIPLYLTQNYIGNITIGGALTLIGNGKSLVSAVDGPVVTINAGANRVVIDDLEISLLSVSRLWTDCDGILIIGESGTDDYTTLRNILVRGAPGYGLYAYGATNGETVQRLHVYDSTIVDSEYANVRLEGIVLEAQFHGCFFNDGCQAGANPVTTNQTDHDASPARTFRRASVELLRWFTAANTCTNDITPNRILFTGCNFATNEGNTGTSRSASVYISGGESITFNTCNFEKPYPAIWFAVEDGASGNLHTSSRNVVVDNCTFLMLHDDTNVANPIIEWDGFINVQFRNPNIGGAVSPESDCFIHNNMSYFYAGLLSLDNFTVQNSVVWTNGFINRESTAYCPTRSNGASTPRYFSIVAGVNRVVMVGKASASHTLSALTSQFNSLNTKGFVDGMRIFLSCDPAVNGNLTVNHNSDDGDGGVLSGKFTLSGASNATLDATWKRIELQWDEENDLWIEVGRNF